MRAARYFLIVFLGLLTLPLASLVVLSFQNVDGEMFKWYISIMGNESFTSALLLTTGVSILVGACTVLLAFLLSLSWYDRRQLSIVLVLILVIGLLPPDIFSLGLNRFAQAIGFRSSNLFFLVLGLVSYALPIGVLLFWARYYFIDPTVIVAAKDIGMKRIPILAKVILPLSSATVTACFLLSFLLAFNEYPRTYYLSGSNTLLSEFLNGKLSSGADESIYAGGSSTILMSLVFIAGYVAVLRMYTARKARRQINTLTSLA